MKHHYLCYWSYPMQAAMSKMAAEGLSASVAAKRLSHQFGVSLTRCSVLGRAHRTGVAFNGRSGRPVRPHQNVPIAVGEARA